MKKFHDELDKDEVLVIRGLSKCLDMANAFLGGKAHVALVIRSLDGNTNNSILLSDDDNYDAMIAVINAHRDSYALNVTSSGVEKDDPESKPA